MTGSKKNHLREEQREVIEEGIRCQESANRIARKIGVSPPTVTREVRNNRTIKEIRIGTPKKLSSRLEWLY